MSIAPIRRYLRHGLLPQLAVFEASARLGSFTRAAEELHLAQPTVSSQMKKLTETVGLPLFEQIGKKIHLTAAGHALCKGTRELIGTLERIDQSLASLRGLHAGRLQLAAGTGSEHFLPQLLAAFAARHPAIEVSLEFHNRRRLIERLAANDDDLYVFANPPAEEEVVSQVIAANPIVACARADHPLARERAIPLARLAREPFLAREPGSGTRLVCDTLFERRGVAPNVRMELSSNEAIRRAILAGLGVSIISRHALRVDDTDVAVLDVEGLPLDRPWQIVYPVGKQVTPIAQAFMTLAREEAKRSG
jgi:LysR family transcriptional regulator, low CO2-responsive transcriptional regulator